MKKISLTFALIGIMSAAIFANTLSTPQEGKKVNKAEKVQPASTQKPVSTQQVKPATQRAEPTQTQQSAKPVQPQAAAVPNQKSQNQTAKPASHQPLRKVGTAKPAIKAMPAGVQKNK